MRKLKRVSSTARKARPAAKSRQAAPVNGSPEDKHVRELGEVRRYVQAELIRAGFWDEPTRDDWACRDVAMVPTAGSVTSQREFRGRAAVVLLAGYVVEEAYSYAASPLGRLAALLRSFRHAGAQLLDHTGVNGRAVVAELSNGDLVRRAGIAFGAQRSAPATDFDEMNALLRDAHALVLGTDTMLADLAERAPGTVASRFYEPKGAGPLAHFAWFLQSEGFSTEMITEVLQRMPSRPNQKHEALRWRDKRAAELDKIRHLINRAKAMGLREVGGGTQCASENHPIEDRVCVVASAIDENGRPVVVAFGGCGSLSSADSDGPALDPNRTTIKLKART